MSSTCLEKTTILRMLLGMSLDRKTARFDLPRCVAHGLSDHDYSCFMISGKTLSALWENGVKVFFNAARCLLQEGK
jgi:hypothetical protein